MYIWKISKSKIRDSWFEDYTINVLSFLSHAFLRFEFFSFILIDVSYV